MLITGAGSRFGEAILALLGVPCVDRRTLRLWVSRPNLEFKVIIVCPIPNYSRILSLVVILQTCLDLLLSIWLSDKNCLSHLDEPLPLRSARSHLADTDSKRCEVLLVNDERVQQWIVVVRAVTMRASTLVRPKRMESCIRTGLLPPSPPGHDL